MGWFSKALGKTAQAPAKPVPDLRGVVIHLKDPGDFFGPTRWLDVVTLEDALKKSLNGTGDFDGNEIAIDGSEVIFYVYGSAPDDLWMRMKPALLSKGGAPIGSFAIIRRERTGVGVRVAVE